MAEPAVAPRLLDALQRAERPRPRAVARWPHAHWLAVGTVCLGAFLGQLTASVTSLVFPALERRFDAGFAAVEWVSLSYLLVLVALLAPVGRLSDLVGRKTMYLGGFAVFAAASLGAGLAGNLAVLVACRAVQAVGGAMMQANSVALVARGVPERAMRTALGIQAAAQALGLALGPTLGGLLVTHASWRWAFWVNVPIGALGILAGWFLLPRTFPEGRQSCVGRAGGGRTGGGWIGGGRRGGVLSGDEWRGNGRTGDGRTGGGRRGSGWTGDGLSGDEWRGDGRIGDGQRGGGWIGGGRRGDGRSGNGQRGDGQRGDGWTGRGWTGGGLSGDEWRGDGQRGGRWSGGGWTGGGLSGDEWRGDGRSGGRSIRSGRTGGGLSGDEWRGDGLTGGGQRGGRRTGSGRTGGGLSGSGRSGGGGRFDLAGLVLLAAASTALLLALSAASGLPLPGWAVAVLAVLAVLAAAGLVRQERRADRPIVPPGLVNTPGIRAGLLVALIGYLLLFCPLVLEPVVLTGRGVSAGTAGVVITALPAAFALAATVGGGLLPRGWSDAMRCRVGALTTAAALLVLAVLPGPGPGATVPPLLVAGYGLGLLLPANNALVMRAIPAQSSAVGGGLVNMVRSLGTALGTALPVLAVHLAGAASGGRAVLLLLAAVAVLAARLSAR
ncbi:MFS transporter [Kitasatospora sp. NPDC059673]|uniref:MFS transporter n=1 Tax=Kitasatospora sp. NPDC059673 TaxID=3346901 RepID=UPI0036879152